MNIYIKPELEIMQVVTEQGFLYNSPGRDVGAKQFHPIASSDWESEDEELEVTSLLKQKSLWDE